ncbi:MAG: VOC family protein [Planctomycetales bacterium]|nr:VOC family protein [Planctomycetales bacterium]
MIADIRPDTYFHFGLNISNLQKSVDFYRTFFGTEPLKSYSDYAKFEFDEPPFVLSLLPNPQIPGGPLYHVGMRMPNADALVAIQKRLELSGISTVREEGVECCYAQQSKFWVHDPDRNLWEVYVLQKDLERHGADAPPGFSIIEEEPAVAAIWEHRFGQPLPQRIKANDNSVDEVRFEGSWSMEIGDNDCQRLLEEAYRVLKPGGSVLVHGLAADRPFPNGLPKLEGPIERMKRIPLEEVCHAQLVKAGFRSVQFKKLANNPCFVADGVGLREMRLVGFKPGEGNCCGGTETTTQVTYLGPFKAMTDDDGREFTCGAAVTVPTSVAKSLQDGPHSESFLFDSAFLLQHHD